MASDYVGRLAPSPTGALHLGNVRTFMVAWLRARSQGGRVVFRMEDLDHPRDKPGAAQGAVDDLKWLGFDWDEEHVQSERKEIYRDALNYLRGQGMGSMGAVGGMGAMGALVYPCVCSRRDVESAQSAPHAGEQLRYPGTCRGRFATWAEALAYKGAAPCWRFCVPEGTRVRFHDAFAGDYEQDVAATLGDFPLARDEGGAGYTLACVVDDLLMGVTEVVRGDDLLAATPAQILVAEALKNWKPSALLPSSFFLLPSYLHVPLVVGPDGKRLAKRHGDTRIAAYREAGWRPEEILGLLAASCGWAAPGESVSLRDLLPRFDLSTIPHAPFCLTR
jgi:glutamyl-tRNA synthetase